MKYYLLAIPALLLSACGGSADADPTHAAVTAYLKKTLDDPASYQSARWGQAVAVQQRTLDTMQAAQQRRLWKPLAAHAVSAIDSLHQVKLFSNVAAVRRTSASGMMAARRADSLTLIIDKLVASKDTAHVGQRVWHAYRAKNKLGATQLDSAQFIVYNSGKVERL